MSEFDAHARALKLAGLVEDCLDLYSQQLPVEAMLSEKAVVREAESIWRDQERLIAVSKEFEKMNRDPSLHIPKVDILVGDGKVLVLEFTPRTVTTENGVKPQLNLDKGEVTPSGHRGIRAVLEDHAHKNQTIMIKGGPTDDPYFG